jgi:hypothetical protein
VNLKVGRVTPCAPGDKIIKAPNAKYQQPEKLQTSNSKRKLQGMFEALVLEYSLELGAWNLGFFSMSRGLPALPI